MKKLDLITKYEHRLTLKNYSENTLRAYLNRLPTALWILAVSSLILMAVPLTLKGQPASAEQNPNIILVKADDLGRGARRNFPENCISTFANTLRLPALKIIGDRDRDELVDLFRMADGKLQPSSSPRGIAKYISYIRSHSIYKGSYIVCEVLIGCQGRLLPIDIGGHIYVIQPQLTLNSFRPFLIRGLASAVVMITRSEFFIFQSSLFLCYKIYTVNLLSKYYFRRGKIDFITG